MAAGFVGGYLGYLLGQANYALYKDFDAFVRAAGLQSIEWRILATLNDSGPMPINVLAHEVLAKQPTLTKAVQRMVVNDWLNLCADTADQRRTLVSITGLGRNVIAPLLEEAQTHETRVLQSLGDADTKALKDLLFKLTQLS